jgi:hypothetical protein
MNLTTNGKTKQYLAIIYMLAATTFIVVDKVLPKSTGDVAQQVHDNSSRIITLEAEMRSIKDAVIINRSENRDEHQVINNKLDMLVMQTKK